MSISITDRGNLLDDELRQLAERRLLFALSRFDSRIVRVHMVVFDENGPRGGVDKACRVSVTLRRADNVVISDRDDDIAMCVSRIAERTGRAVARAIENTRRNDRSRPIFPDPSSSN